jgi:hypothetical protein
MSQKNRNNKKQNWGEPLRTVNTNYYHPMLHTTPTGLENTIILDTLGPRPSDKLVVKQKQNASPYKPGPDMNTNADYGQFVEFGGRKTRKNKKGLKKRTKKRKKTIKKRKGTKKKSKRSI